VGVRVVGAFLTSLYAFRLVFLVFFGKEGKVPLGNRFGRASWIPVGILAGLAIVGGFIQLPRNLGRRDALHQLPGAGFAGPPNGARWLRR